MKLIHIIISLAIFMASLSVCAHIQVYFSPSTDCENTIIREIDNAKKNIDIAVYSLTNQNIVEALSTAHGRGVKIRILTDKVQASNQYGFRAFSDLRADGIKIKVHSKNRIQHNKFAIYDNKNVTFGSYNWTKSATQSNAEDCALLTAEPQAQASFTDRFNYLWDINSLEKSEEWFKRKQIAKKY